MPWCKHEVARTSLSYLPVVLVLVMMNTIVMMMMMTKGTIAMMMMSRGSVAMDQAMGVVAVSVRDNTQAPAQGSQHGFAAHFWAAAIQTIRRLTDHLSQPINQIESLTYCLWWPFLVPGGDHSDIEGPAQQSGGRGLPRSRYHWGANIYAIIWHNISWYTLYFDIWYVENIQVPHTWTEMDCRTPLSMDCLTPTSRKVRISFNW